MGVRFESESLSDLNRNGCPICPGIRTGLGHVLDRGVTKGFPHIHDRQINALAFLHSQFVEEQGQACLGAIRAAKPNRSPPDQVAHHNPIGVPLANGNLIDMGRNLARLRVVRNTRPIAHEMVLGRSFWPARWVLPGFGLRHPCLLLLEGVNERRGDGEAVDKSVRAGEKVGVLEKGTGRRQAAEKHKPR